MDDIPNYIGRNLEEVLVERSQQVPGLSHEWSLRVAKRDGAYMVLTRDFDPKRINLFIEEGTIVSQTLG